MEDKILELLGEEGRKFHEEFTRCQTMEEIDEFKERWDRLNESRKDGTLPHYDMTLEEFRSKYHTTSHEEVWERMGGADLKMSKQEQIYQRYLLKKGDCQKYKDIIDYFLYLHQDELIDKLPTESLNVLENAIASLRELANSGKELSIDRKAIKMTIEEGEALLGKFKN